MRPDPQISAHGMATAEKLAQRVAAHGGAALIVDYGRASPPYSDSLVAIRQHRGAHALSRPGTADLSAWVDFGALRLAAEGSGAQVPGVGAGALRGRLCLHDGWRICFQQGATTGALAGRSTTAPQHALFVPPSPGH